MVRGAHLNYIITRFWQRTEMCRKYLRDITKISHIHHLVRWPHHYWRLTRLQKLRIQSGNCAYKVNTLIFFCGQNILSKMTAWPTMQIVRLSLTAFCLSACFVFILLLWDSYRQYPHTAHSNVFPTIQMRFKKHLSFLCCWAPVAVRIIRAAMYCILEWMIAS